MLTPTPHLCKTGDVDQTANGGDQQRRQSLERYHGIDIETAQQDGEGSVLMSKGFRVVVVSTITPLCKGLAGRLSPSTQQHMLTIPNEQVHC